MKKQTVLTILFLLFSTFCLSGKTQENNTNTNEIKIHCEFIARQIKDDSCRIRFTSTGMLIQAKEQEFNIPNRQILAQASYEFINTGIKTRKYTNLFLVIDPDSKSSNRTDVLSISTSSFGGFITNSKRYSNLMDEIAKRLSNSEKISFNEVIAPKSDDSVKGGLASQQLQQLLNTKICIRCDLRNVNLEAVNLKRANLEGANLEGANLSGANLKNAYLVGTNLNNAKMDNIKLSDAFLYHASMEKASLENADLDKASLQEANLSNSILREAKSTFRITFAMANLRNADLSNAHLKGANFSYADLQNANLEGASFSFDPDMGGSISNFTGANLSNANLTKTNLRQSELGEANLYRANLREAKLSGSNFKSARHCQTILPDGKISNENC